MCGTIRKLQRHLVTRLCGPCFLVTYNVYVLCGNMCGTIFKCVEQKIHTHTLMHVNYSPDTIRKALNIASNLHNKYSMCSGLSGKYLLIYCYSLQSS